MVDEARADAGATNTVVDRYLAGDRFGQYEIRRHIGSGGMAEVYEAVHLALDKRVALKVLSKACAANEQLRRRFLHEGRRAARIRHDHVVDITDVGEVDGVPYLVMELLEGETLGDRLDRDRSMPIQEAVHLIVPVVAAAYAGHKEGVVHRDLKPENILLAREGAQRVRPKVLDFGVSRSVDEDHDEKLTLPNAVLGTPVYMSPEQARGDDCDERSDQFTLAVVFYEMITGEVPRNAESLLKALNSAASGAVTPPSDHLPDIDPELEAVIMQALERDADHRFPDLRAFAMALLRWASPRAQEYWENEFTELGGLVSNPPSVDSFGPPSVSGEHRVTLKDSSAGVSLSDAPRRSRSRAASGLAEAVKTTTPSVAPPAGVSPVATTTLGEAGSQPQRRRAVPLPLLALGLLVAVGGVMWWMAGSSEPPSAGAPAAEAPGETFAVHLQVSPAAASIELDGAVVGHGSYSTELPKDGRSHEVVFRLAGHEPREITFKDVPPPATTVQLTEIEAAAAATSTTAPAARPRTAVASRPQPRPGPRPTTKKPPESETSSPPPAPKPKPAGDDWPVTKPSDNKNPWKD